MAIITKPSGGIFKGTPAEITLNKSELALLPIVLLDDYFSVTTNWNKIILSYKSSEGNQQEIVEFDATLSSPTGFFDVSLKARDLFEIQVIKIIDFDGDIFIIPRSELTTSDFDVEFLNPPSNLSYTTPVTYTQNQQITNNVPTVTGTVTSYSISPALPTGLSINPTTGIISGTPTVVVAATSHTVTASNSGGSTTANISITVEAEAPAVQSVTWNVAGKTGVGTVTTGVNGLITKTTGGSSYNVNVLSNETITGDGYVEFINSSIFLNVVFGLAEINSSSGSYNQIIYGTYVAALGAYERVLAGQAISGGIAASAYGDVIRIQRIGNIFSILKNGSVINTVTINNTNPLKASVSIYPSTSYGVNNVTISE
jgi:hypothetical protein